MQRSTTQIDIIGFTGHRDCIADDAAIMAIEQRYPGAVWVHGGAEGFDAQVDTIGKRLGKIPGQTLITIRPDYNRYAYKVAPLRRNDVIVDMVRLLIACYDGRKGGGTAYTINKARTCGVPVEIIRPIYKAVKA